MTTQITIDRLNAAQIHRGTRQARHAHARTRIARMQRTIRQRASLWHLARRPSCADRLFVERYRVDAAAFDDMPVRATTAPMPTRDEFAGFANLDDYLQSHAYADAC